MLRVRMGRWVCTLIFAAAVCSVSAGCPELNRWSGPTQDPFFSVADDNARPLTETATADATSASQAAAPNTGRDPAARSAEQGPPFDEAANPTLAPEYDTLRMHLSESWRPTRTQAEGVSRAD